jgi:hypothetical protein
MHLSLEDGTEFSWPNDTTLDHWLRTLSPGGPNSFAIFNFSEGDFIQTACEAGRYVLERRTVEPAHHYRGVRRDGSDLFDIEEVVIAFTSFTHEVADLPFLVWHNIDHEVGL